MPRSSSECCWCSPCSGGARGRCSAARATRSQFPTSSARSSRWRRPSSRTPKFEVSVDTQTSDEPKNQVLTQDPTGDIEAEEGSTVNLVVSAGPEQVVVPDVEGLTEEAAIERLRAEGFTYAFSNDVPSEQPAGIVVGSDPAQGTTQDAGTDVTLDVSNGEVKVPDVVGDSEASARAEMDTAGFEVTVVYQETDDDSGRHGDRSVGHRLRPNRHEHRPHGRRGATRADQNETPSPTPSDTTTNNGNGNGDPP